MTGPVIVCALYLAGVIVAGLWAAWLIGARDGDAVVLVGACVVWPVLVLLLPFAVPYWFGKRNAARRDRARERAEIDRELARKAEAFTVREARDTFRLDEPEWALLDARWRELVGVPEIERDETATVAAAVYGLRPARAVDTPGSVFDTLTELGAALARDERGRTA